MTDLLAAADQLFASSGYEATTMNAIASLAGSSIGSLYQFFPNKESVGNALLLEYMKELSGQIVALKAASPLAPQVLGQKLIEIVFNYSVEHPACRVLADVPSVQKTESFGVYSASVLDLLSACAPSMKAAELSSIATTSLLMVRAAVHGSRLVDAKTGATLRHEMQQAIGTYLEERLKIPLRRQPGKTCLPSGASYIVYARLPCTIDGQRRQRPVVVHKVLGGAGQLCKK